MRYILTALSLLLITCICSQKVIGQNSTGLGKLEDGFYVVLKTANDESSLQDISEGQRIITYNKEFLDPDDDQFLVIDATDFVPLSLKEKPTSEQQADKSQNFYLALNDIAKSKLEQFTTVNLYKITAIVVDGEAYTKHKIKSVIDGGYLQITQCTENTCRLLYDQFEDNVVGLPSHKDWANLQRFASKNKTLEIVKEKGNRVVFMGNSITEEWPQKSPGFIDNPSYINRGISGQTTAQMLVRFRPDVIDLKPDLVVLLAGINDIAGNTGPMSLETIANNIKSMAELAKVNGIKVILCSILPAYDFPWNPGLNPSKKVIQLNKMIQDFAKQNDMVYLDYHSEMVDERLGMKKELSRDEVHPNVKGYKIMEPLLEEAIKKALGN